ncbi:MAG: hypothetical protein L3I91_01120 [Mycoplasma sp.]
MSDRELVYLFQSENLSIAKQILFDKYFVKMQLASLKYWKQYPLDYQPLSRNDLASLSYLTFNQTLNTFDVKNTKYEFKQALFIINRTIVGHQLKYYLNNNGQRILNNAFSISNDKCLSNLISDYHAYKTDERTNNKLYLEQIMLIIHSLFLKIKNKEKLNWYWDRINGMKLNELEKKYHVDPITISKFVYFINNQVRNQLKNQPR